MRIALFGTRVDKQDAYYLQQLVSRLEGAGAGLSIYEPLYDSLKKHITFLKTPLFFNTGDSIPADTDYLFSIGGDGTMLGTVPLIHDKGIPVLGINLGRLGFLSSVPKKSINSALEEVLAGGFTLDKRTLVRLDCKENPFGDINYALNEVSINKSEPLSMLNVEVFVNEKYLNTYWADGLLVATSTGSTAYSLSCGGPIITPESHCFVITPIASHNLPVRPIVIPDDSIIRIRVTGREKKYIVGLDSRKAEFDSPEDFIIRKEAFTFNMIIPDSEEFFKTIREKLMWGLDIRN
ncbi:MAG: NAD kinase [Marinilabiliales bacterium]|nr:MAG: NAD kinase [Marinilabiliales bacterium]